MPTIAFFDTKPYDREFIGSELAKVAGIDPRWLDFRLTESSIETARGAASVCLFVNDRADRSILTQLATLGIKHLALRCAGFNNVDLAVAREFGIAVTRVPAYSPHAVAEHTLALLLTLNRKIHRAYNRVREHNFSLGGLVGFDLHGKTIGIIGTGKIGRITAQIFRGFGAKVLAFDLAPDATWAATHDLSYTHLD